MTLRVGTLKASRVHHDSPGVPGKTIIKVEVRADWMAWGIIPGEGRQEPHGQHTYRFTDYPPVYGKNIVRGTRRIV